MKAEQIELKECLLEYQAKKERNFISVFFPMYMEGNYTNYEDYISNKNFIENTLKLNNKEKELKSLTRFMIPKFIDFLTREFNLSRFIIVKIVKDTFKENLQSINKELVNLMVESFNE